MSRQYGPHDRFGDRQNGSRAKGQPEIKKQGDSIILPQNMDVTQVIKVLERKQMEEETDRCIQEKIPVSPIEGAIALTKALKEMYGLTLEAGGSSRSVDIGVNETMQVHWGRYDLPMGGFVETGVEQEDGRFVFKLHAHVLGKNEHSVRSLITRVRRFAAEESPYRGKAFSLTLTDEDGQTMEIPRIQFLDLPTGPVTVILRPEIERDIMTSIWGPIQHTDAVRKMGTPLRRGVLLAGAYGTGKTLTATRTAQIARENGWTFMYLPKASDLSQALHIARQYEPCIVFAEDLDRVTGKTRTDSVNTIINALDGVETKTAEVMVVFTTNFPENINSAMQRPGRIDTAINLLPPDGPTAARLLEYYSGELLAPGQELGPVGEELTGEIPARLREVVERAKLAVVASGAQTITITSADLSYAAGSVRRERELFAGPKEGQTTGEDVLVSQLGAALVSVGSRNRNGHSVPA